MLLLAKAVDAKRVDDVVATAMMIAIMDRILAFMYIKFSQTKNAIT